MEKKEEEEEGCWQSERWCEDSRGKATETLEKRSPRMMCVCDVCGVSPLGGSTATKLGRRKYVFFFLGGGGAGLLKVPGCN